MRLASGKFRLWGILQPYQWSFVGYLILAALIPKFYELSNTFWIGHISYEALAITEQYEFLAVTLEIVNETIPFGVLALVAQNFRDKEKVISIIKSGLVVQVLFSGLLMSVVVFFTPQFVSSIGTPPEIVSLTSNYLILKSLALPFEAVAALLLIAVKSMRRGRDVLYLVFFSVVLNMVLDLFLISNASFSLNLGVQGVAIGYVSSKVALFAVTFIFVVRIMGVNSRSLLFSFSNVKDMLRPLFSIGGWTGLDSLVRNIGYILVPLNVLNLIGANQFGGYGLAMTVMWTVIIPVLAITEGTNVVVGNYYGERRYEDLKKVVLTSLFLVSAVMAAIFLGGILFWRSLSYFFNQNPVIVDYSVTSFWWLIIPYCLFALSMVLRSVFYGTGKTKYIFIVSGVLNFGLIFPFWALSKLNLLTVSFENVMALFVVVFAVDLLITYFLVKRTVNNMK
jgi:Na+-driven multidrug efflux pump